MSILCFKLEFVVIMYDAVLHCFNPKNIPVKYESVQCPMLYKPIIICRVFHCICCPSQKLFAGVHWMWYTVLYTLRDIFGFRFCSHVLLVTELYENHLPVWLYTKDWYNIKFWLELIMVCLLLPGMSPRPRHWPHQLRRDRDVCRSGDVTETLK